VGLSLVSYSRLLLLFFVASVIGMVLVLVVVEEEEDRRVLHKRREKSHLHLIPLDRIGGRGRERERDFKRKGGWDIIVVRGDGLMHCIALHFLYLRVKCAVWFDGRWVSLVSEWKGNGSRIFRLLERRICTTSC
jgi:hypothetical protein